MAIAATDDTKQPSEQRPNRRGKPDSSNRTASNNMSRRRNRINANLLAADELEEKTKTEQAAGMQ